MDTQKQLVMAFPSRDAVAKFPPPSTVPFQPNDTEAWLKLCRNGLFPPDADLAFAQAELSRFPSLCHGDILFATAEDGDKIATACGMLFPNGDGYLHWICAAPQARGKGIAAALICHIAQKLYDRGARRVYLTTDDHRLAAIKTYLRIGLRPVLADASDQTLRARWNAVCHALGMDLTDSIPQCRP